MRCPRSCNSVNNIEMPGVCATGIRKRSRHKASRSRARLRAFDSFMPNKPAICQVCKPSPKKCRAHKAELNSRPWLAKTLRVKEKKALSESSSTPSLSNRIGASALQFVNNRHPSRLRKSSTSSLVSRSMIRSVISPLPIASVRTGAPALWEARKARAPRLIWASEFARRAVR